MLAMAAERSFWHRNLRLAAAGAGFVATSLLALAPAWSGPVTDASVIVDLSVINDLSTSDTRALSAGDPAAGQPYARLIADWPARTVAALRARSMTPIRPLTHKAAHLLEQVTPSPRIPATSSSSAKTVDSARLLPPPQILAAVVPVKVVLRHGQAPAGMSPAQAMLFPPPDPLPSAEAPKSGSNATGWGAEPTANPADGTQVAVPSPARPPANPSENGALRLRLVYAANGVEIPSTGKPQLESLAGEVKPDGSLRIQLAAYAGGRNMSSSTARRMSLSRALSVRSFLIDHGIAAGRIDVRALGNTSGTGEADRVDVVVLDQ